MKKTKQALLHSGIALLLCISMLIGSTFAWFSDSISSGKNIITAGNLDLEMYWTDDLDSGKWYNVEENGHNTIFNYDNWEPGYTDVKYIKLVNAGDLALNYKLSLTPQNGVGKLAEVINVYFAEGGVAVEQRSDLQSLRSIGLLDNVLNGGATADGTLLSADQYSPLHPSGEVVMTVAMNMLTTAGNEYQNEDAGKFSITALATQAPFEMDSFGSDYDANAEYPTVLTAGSATTTVTPVDNKVPAGGVMLNGGSISAFVPEGVALEAGTTELTLTVTPLKNTTSDIVVVNDEVLIPVDVHIDGVSEDNTVPIIVDLGEILPKYLNMGNYHLYHVEDGSNSVMTLVADKTALTAHNQFTYDPLTGAVSVAMASFSEVTILADTAAKWEGKEDNSWYNTTATELYIANADQLYSFAKIVGGMDADYAQDSFADKTVKLLSDINLNHATVIDDGIKRIFYPVGYYNTDDGTYEDKDSYDDKTGVAITSGFYTFEGTFDGAGHTISNIYQNTWEMKGDHNWYAPEDQHYRDGMGLFGKVYGGTVKNLTVDNFESDGEITTTGVIASYADYGATFENIAITNCNPRVYNIGNGGIVGCVGWYTKAVTDKVVTFKNITVDNSNMISALWGSYDVACGGIVGQYYPTSGQSSANYPANPGIHFENCHVAAVMDVYNDVCANYQYYAYRYAGMMIGSIRENLPADENGHIYPDMTGITAEGCTVHYDTWNDYYYCELVANSKASYTHDHQFSRLEQVESVDVSNMKVTSLKGTTTDIPTSGRYNYVVVNDEHATENATCYHFVDGAVWSHADAGTETVNGVEIAVEDHAHIYLPFKQLFTGYGWGVTSRWLEAFDGIGVTERDSKDLIDKFEKNKALDGDFLYRVGNGNAFPIGNLFQAIDENLIVDSGVHVSVDSLIEGVKFNTTFTNNEKDWTQSTLHITGGTGPALLTIQDYNNCNEFTIKVEVVDAENVVSYGDLKDGQNSVFLNNITMSSGGTYRLTGNHVIYGNGFVFDVTNGAYAGVDYDYMSYVVYLEDSRLDNIQIEGAVYPEIGSDRTKDYNRATVMTSGNCSIVNSFISNGASPIRNGGNLELVNTTLKGGIYSNLDQRNGHLILDNVTTINQIGANDKYNGTTEIVGMGIVIYQEGGTEDLKITIRNNLTQYNYLSKTQADTYLTGTYPTAIKGVVFGSDFTDYQNNGWVNFGIISMNNYFTGDDLVDQRTNKQGYFGTAKTVTLLASSRDCYVYSFKPTSTSAPDYAGYSTAGQGVIEPDVNFDFINKNYQAKVEGSNDYCYADNGKILISMDEGDTVNWDTSILSATKNGKTLEYTVSFDGDDYTGKSIAFSQKGNYEVKYTFTDNYNFDISGDGVSSFSETYTETLEIEVAVVEAAAKHAVFSFGANGTAYSAKTVIIGDKTYVMPDVTATVDGKIGSTTVNGTTVYYPITEMYTSDNKTAHTGSWYACFPIFKDAVQIVDYADGGTGDPVTYNQTNVTTVANIPSTLKATNPTSAFLYQMNATNYPPPTDPTAVSGAVCYTSNRNGLTASNTRTEFTINAEYTYTDNAGTVYYYYVGYHCAEQTNGGGTCLAEGTMITLSDGSKKAIEDLRKGDSVMSYDHLSGKVTNNDVIIVVKTQSDFYKNTFVFDNGTELVTINEHGIYDLNLQKYVNIDHENFAEYVGHSFVSIAPDGKLGTKKLVNVVSEWTSGYKYDIVANQTLNYVAEDTLSVTHVLVDIINSFEFDENMLYDQVKMQEDIEKYGLYSYDEWAEYCDISVYEQYNIPVMKIGVSKGLYTKEYIISLINTYVLDESVQIID